MNEQDSDRQARLRAIPPVNSWLERPEIAAWAASMGRETATATLRQILDELRATIRSGERPDIERFVLARFRERRNYENRTGLRRVINATGILLHTGLGRAPLAADAVDAIAATAAGYCNLEFDLANGERGRRVDAVRDLVRKITGAEAATVVNNNAAATILTLRAIAAGREVIVSRGQLVEIGGGFRMPEIMAVSGAILKEVGTTNRTRIRDFENAIGPQTAALLRVHTSNYAIVGFAEEPEPGELAALAHGRGLVYVDDIGSGALTAADLPAGMTDPTVADSLAQGADIVLFSGDKLLGGPQCGIIVGSKTWIDRIEADPLMRAFRVDKLTLAALGATLRAWTEAALRNLKIPFWRMLTEPVESVRFRAAELAGNLSGQGWCVQVRPSEAFAGGGSLPAESIASFAAVITPPWPVGITGETGLAARLREELPAIVGRVHDQALWLDSRTIAPEEHGIVADVFRRVIESSMDRGGSAEKTD